MPSQIELLSLTEADALHDISVIHQGDSSLLRAAQAPHEGISPLRGKAGMFEQLRLGARFLASAPGAANYLKGLGYELTEESQADGGTIIEGRYPELGAQDNGEPRFIPFRGTSYSAREFFEHLGRGEVLTSVDPEGNFDTHDAIFHNTMWKLMATTPGFMDALKAKAERTLTAADRIPPREPGLWGPEPTELAHARLIAKHDVGGLMGRIDYQISLGGNITTGLRQSIHNNPHQDYDGKAVVGHALREIFSHAIDPWSENITAPDPEVADEQISAWTESLIKLAA